MIDTLTKALEGMKETVKDKIPDFTNVNDVKNRGTSDNIPDFTSGLTTRNEKLEDKKHSETGVPFEKKEINIDGETVEGVFPNFDEVTSVELTEDMYKSKDSEQFKYCNTELKKQIENNPELKVKFTDEQIEQIEAGRTPKGYTWHHSEEVGKMELVDTGIHAKTGHTGGKVIWGGGNENR